MVQISSAFLSLLLVVPTLAAPITFEILETREPSFFKSIVKDIKKVATPKNIKTAARVASILFRREDGGELTERDVQGLSTHLEDLVRREPNFRSFLHKVKKVATPHNIKTVASIVGSFVRRELPETMPHLVTRDLSSTETFEELLAREPNFHSFLHKVKKVATPHNIRTVANIVGSFVRRELSEDEVTELVTRSLLGDEDLEDLLVREPNHPDHPHGGHGHSHPHHGRGHHGGHHHSERSESNSLSPRGFEEDVSDLEARDPHGDEPHSHKHGHHKRASAHGPHHHHRSKHHQSENLQARELEEDFEDLLSREGEDGAGSHQRGHHHHRQHHAPTHAHGHGHGHGHGAHGHHPDLVARDLYYAIDELD